MYIESSEQRFRVYKEMAEKAIAQIDEQQIFFAPNEASNSIAIIMQHMAGNMLSRWTNFLDSDGEKDWRDRDTEFELQHSSKQTLMQFWEKGWACLFDALAQISENDLARTIYIRKEPLSVLDAINRQLAHYSYHVGQIVYIAKMIQNENWNTLSIPKKK